MGKYAIHKILNLILVSVLLSKCCAVPVRSKREVQGLPLLHEDYDDYSSDNSDGPIVDDGTSQLSPLDERGSEDINGHVEYMDNLHGNRSGNGDHIESLDHLDTDANIRDIDLDHDNIGQTNAGIKPDAQHENMNENVPDIGSENVNRQAQNGLPSSEHDVHNSSSARQGQGDIFPTTRLNRDDHYEINAVGRAMHNINASILGDRFSDHEPQTRDSVSTNTSSEEHKVHHGFLMGGNIMVNTSEEHLHQHGFLIGGDFQNVDNEQNSDTLTTRSQSLEQTTRASTPEPFITVRLSNMSSHELTESSSPEHTNNNDIVIDRTDQSSGRRGNSDQGLQYGQDITHDSDKDSTTELPLTNGGQVATLPGEPNIHEHESGEHLNGQSETENNGHDIDIPIDKGEHHHNDNSEENNEPGLPRHTNNPVVRTPVRNENSPVTESILTTPNLIILPTPANLEPEERRISNIIHEPHSTATVHGGENEQIEPVNAGNANQRESGESRNSDQGYNTKERHEIMSEGHTEFVTEFPFIRGENEFKPNKNLLKYSDGKSQDMSLLVLPTSVTLISKTAISGLLTPETEKHSSDRLSNTYSIFENSGRIFIDETMDRGFLHSSTITYSEINSVDRKQTCVQSGNQICSKLSIIATGEQLSPTKSFMQSQRTDARQPVRGLEETTPGILLETSTTDYARVTIKQTRTNLLDQILTSSIVPTKTVAQNFQLTSIERNTGTHIASMMPIASSLGQTNKTLKEDLNNNFNGPPTISFLTPLFSSKSNKVVYASPHSGTRTVQVYSSSEPSQHAFKVYSSTDNDVHIPDVHSGFRNSLQTPQLYSDTSYSRTDNDSPTESSMPVQFSQVYSSQVFSSDSMSQQYPVASAIFPMLTLTSTTKKKVEHSTTLSSTPSTQKKPNSDKEPDKPDIEGSTSSSTTPSTPGLVSTTLRASTARLSTTQKLETSTQPSVYIEIELKMDLSQFCVSKLEFISGIKEIIRSEKGYVIDDEQFVLSTEDCASSNNLLLEADHIPIITIKMYIVDNDGKLDIVLTTETSSFILKGFQQSNFLKDKIVSVHTVNRKPPQLLPESRPERRQEPPNVTMVIVLASMGGICCVALIILQVLIHRRVKAKRKQRQFIGHRASLQSMDHVALGVIPKSRPSSGYWNPALDNTLEEPEPEDHSHILNFSGLANFCMDTKAIYAEFQAIPHEDVGPTSITIGEEDKNRFANVLPHKHNRVYLKKTQENKSGYINANYVDGYMGERRVYIATQSPMMNTVDDFWRMVWEQQTRTILMLNPMTPQGKPKQSTCYWPDNLETDSQREFQDYIVTLKKRDVQKDYVDCTLEIIDIEKNLKREIHHFWFTCWSDTGPPEPLTFVKFVLDTRPHYENSGSPALVHCGPGTGRTGTFIAVDICMRMFEDRRRVDILNCVHKLRGERAGAIQTKEQYFLIYQALNEYGVILSSPSISTRSSIITLHAML